MWLFNGKKILITGGTGSLGKALTKRFLEANVDVIRIFSRGELQQVQMQSEFKDNRLRFLIGDIRDKERLSRSLEDIDIVIHAAALKHVPIAEYNPFEAVKTNVYGAQNLIECCLDKDIEKVLAVGTDKAVAPLNTYGATKMLMERLFISANYYKGYHKTKFLCVRYGNVLGSRGSIVPTLVEQVKNGNKMTLTDPNMSRFNITMNEAFKLILRALERGVGGEVFIPKLKAYKTGDMVDSIAELMKLEKNIERIAIRPGEKFHESLISMDELRNVYETIEDYIIFEQSQYDDININEIKGIKKSNLRERYSSDKAEILTKEEIKKILLREKLIPNV
jgi:UDP-N-acetylglucosamine 4,6-dehydratase/UDP-glucose 4-epimerase